MIKCLLYVKELAKRKKNPNLELNILLRKKTPPKKKKAELMDSISKALLDSMAEVLLVSISDLTPF